ncbi:MAG TPA: hypothetical protein VGQ06_10030 [Gemmatimonadales bacterium]|nr:hypothetical protein [Gemmatimonadales bacterium]
MVQQQTRFIVPGLVLAGLLAGCSPDAVSPGPPNFTTCADKKEECGGGTADFRLTGGGRIDKPGAGLDGAEEPTGKNTPDSRDFATFGFQARPGSGNITWVDHNPDGFGGGFTFHGQVSTLEPVEDHRGEGAMCGRFFGTGRGRTRDGGSFGNISFFVDHACDKAEPGVGNDHIRMFILDFNYDRAGILTGGNIQWHRLTGNGA